MPQKIEFSNEKKEKIIRMYNNGESVSSIAKHFDMYAQPINKNLRKWGIKIRPNRFYLKMPIPPKTKQEIIAMYESGMSVHDIAIKTDYSHDTIHRRLKEWEVFLRDPAHFYKYDVNHDAFANINENSAYFAGYIMADGHVSAKNNGAHVVSLTSKDRDIVQKFRAFLGDESRPIIDNGSNVNVIHISSRRLYEDLGKIGIHERKSFTAAPSSEVRLNRHFWRGSIDGDGSVSWVRSGSRRYPFIGFYTASEDYKNALIDFCEYHRLPQFNVHKRRIYTCTKTGSGAAKIIKFLYEGNNVSLNRKNKVAKEILSDRRYR